MKKRIKSGDEVVIIAGAHRGKRGKILQVLNKNDRVVVEGVAMRKHHKPKTQDNPEGTIEEREGSVHASNVMLAERYDSKKEKQQV